MSSGAISPWSDSARNWVQLQVPFRFFLHSQPLTSPSSSTTQQVWRVLVPVQDTMEPCAFFMSPILSFGRRVRQRRLCRQAIPIAVGITLPATPVSRGAYRCPPSAKRHADVLRRLGVCVPPQCSSTRRAGWLTKQTADAP